MKLWQRLKGWAKALRREVLLLWLAARDTRVPLVPKVIAVLVTGYALSPIDLIPDFIPVLGLIDDLVFVPAGIWLALRLLPGGLVAELRMKAEQTPWPRPSLRGAIFVAVIWLSALLAGTWWWKAG